MTIIGITLYKYLGQICKPPGFLLFVYVRQVCLAVTNIKSRKRVLVSQVFTKSLLAMVFKSRVLTYCKRHLKDIGTIMEPGLKG